MQNCWTLKKRSMFVFVHSTHVFCCECQGFINLVWMKIPSAISLSRLASDYQCLWLGIACFWLWFLVFWLQNTTEPFALFHYCICDYVCFNVMFYFLIRRNKENNFLISPSSLWKHTYIILTLNPHFYIAKLGFTGVYIIFHISAQKHRFVGTH